MKKIDLLNPSDNRRDVDSYSIAMLGGELKEGPAHLSQSDDNNPLFLAHRLDLLLEVFKVFR